MFDSIAQAMIICKAIEGVVVVILCIAIFILVYKLLKHFA